MRQRAGECGGYVHRKPTRTCITKLSIKFGLCALEIVIRMWPMTFEDDDDRQGGDATPRFETPCPGWMCGTGDDCPGCEGECREVWASAYN